MIPQVRKLAWVLSVGLLLAPVVANAGNISNVIFRIDATNTVGSGYLEFTSDLLSYQPATNQWVWTTGMSDIVTGGGDVIATLDSATLKLVKDPVVTKPYYIELGFTLHAGVSDTDFQITSALIDFPTLQPGQLQPPDGGGRATASLTATDVNGDGVTLMPEGSNGSGAYRAEYDGWAPGGITFASLVGEMTFGPGGSGNASQSYPGTGYAPINDPVYDMSAVLAFNLTYGDSASGTTTYRILPEPVSGLGALVLALALSWRRR
jgi:MYXO-CTERM domain-containing protein